MKSPSASDDKNKIKKLIQDSNAFQKYLQARDQHLSAFRTLDVALKITTSCEILGKRKKDHKPKTSSQRSLKL